MRASGGTNFGLALSVVARTNSTMTCLAGLSFQEGSGSVCAWAAIAGGRAAPCWAARLKISNAFVCLLAHGGPGRLDLRFHGIEVEAGALLHRRELDGRHDELLHLLLDKHEAPEFVLEPLEVILRPGLGPAIGPARTLEGIETEVGQVGHVGLGLVAE